MSRYLKHIIQPLTMVVVWVSLGLTVQNLMEVKSYPYILFCGYVNGLLSYWSSVWFEGAVIIAVNNLIKPNIK